MPSDRDCTCPAPVRDGEPCPGAWVPARRLNEEPRTTTADRVGGKDGAFQNPDDLVFRAGAPVKDSGGGSAGPPGA